MPMNAERRDSTCKYFRISRHPVLRPRRVAFDLARLAGNNECFLLLQNQKSP